MPCVWTGSAWECLECTVITFVRLKAFTELFRTQGVLLPTYRGLWKRVRSFAVNWRDQSHTEGNFKPFSSPNWIFLLMANSCKIKRLDL